MGRVMGGLMSGEGQGEITLEDGRDSEQAVGLGIGLERDQLVGEIRRVQLAPSSEAELQRNGAAST